MVCSDRMSHMDPGRQGRVRGGGLIGWVDFKKKSGEGE